MSRMEVRIYNNFRNLHSPHERFAIFEFICFTQTCGFIEALSFAIRESSAFPVKVLFYTPLQAY